MRRPKASPPSAGKTEATRTSLLEGLAKSTPMTMGCQRGPRAHLSQTARFREIAFGMNRLHESGKRCKVEKQAGTLAHNADATAPGAPPKPEGAWSACETVPLREHLTFASWDACPTDVSLHQPDA